MQTVQNLTRQLAESKKTTQMLTMQIAQKEQSLQALAAQFDQTTNELEQMKAEVLTYALSRSWRMTRPARKVARWIRRRKNAQAMD